jgi:REP element-mobilizing transposase RayT
MRLHGYDYSCAGLYFLTIVVQNRLHLFGHIRNREMVLNDAGCMVEMWYREIENKFPDKRCHEMMVMPNHFHCIIENMKTDAHVSPMDAHVSPMDAHVSPTDAHVSPTDAHVGAPLRGRPVTTDRPATAEQIISNDKFGLHNKKYGASIGDVMDWFKTMTTNEYIRGVKNKNWQRYNGKLWQRNYYDHIIRDLQEDARVSAYIMENPASWDNDTFNFKK